MIFLAITPKGLADALKSARKNDHVWCGKNAVPEDQYETLKRKVTIFTYTFTGPGSVDDVQGAVWTMKDHYPGHTVWVERIPSE